MGNSHAVSLPASWIKYLERKTGQKICEVAIEVDDELTIRPFLKHPVDDIASQRG